MANGTAITQEIAIERCRVALRLFLGRDKPYSLALLSEATGIDERTLRSYADGESAPNLERLLRLMRELGPHFANHLLELAGLGGVRPIDPEPCDAPKLLADTAALTADLAGKLADGKLDHRERADLRKTLRKHVAACEAALAALERAE